jgi:aspartate 1-decarboxylase
MLCEMLKCKIHMATVTGCVLQYEGSIGIDRDLIAKAGLLPFERVLVANVNNGERFETYVIEAPAGSGEISLNGAAARYAQPGDKVIIMCFCLLEESEARTRRPSIVMLDERNGIRK